MTVTYPNESDSYRKARNALLEAEAALRDQTERVAALRRELPLGGALKDDYLFEELEGGTKRGVKLSQLFREGQATLFLYGFMFGPAADQPCPLCTAFLDSLNANAPHISQQISVAVAARAPIDELQPFAAGRGWNNLRLVSSNGNSFQSDYHAEKGDSQMPMANVFVRRDGTIHHHWGSELLFAPSDHDSRHIDMMWPLWNVLDLTPAGRGDWYPQLAYD